jgi:DnaJ family protein A protein 5
MDSQAAATPSKGSGAGTPVPRTAPTPVAKFVEQDWQKIKIADDDNFTGQWDDAEGAEEWECVACGKSFRSEAAWLSHERSRKHLKEVERYLTVYIVCMAYSFIQSVGCREK